MKAILFLIAILGCSLIRSYGQGVADSLERLLQTTTLHDTVRCKVLGDLSREYRFTDPEKSLQYGKEELALALKAMPKQVPFALYRIGYAYYFLELNDSALLYFNRCDELLGPGDRSELKATLQGGLSQVYAKYGISNKQIDYAIRGHELTEAMSKNTQLDHTRIGRSYLDLGLTYFGIEQYREALKYYVKAQKRLELAGDSLGLLRLYMNLGALYHSERNYDSAQYCYEKAAVVGASYTDTPYYAEIFLGLSAINLEQMKLDKALSYAARVSESAMDSSVIAENYRNLGVIYMNRKNYKLARAHLNSALEIARSLDVDEMMASAHENLYLLDSMTGNYAGALENFRNFHVLNSKLNSTAAFQEIGQLETRFRINEELKEAERKKQERIAAQLREQLRLRQILYKGVTAFLIIIISVILSLKYLKNNSSVTEVLSLVATLLLFEFLLILTEPYTDSVSNGNPIIKLMLNFFIALMLVPVDRLINKLLRMNTVSRNLQDAMSPTG